MSFTPGLPVTDFQFLQAFKREGERVHFKNFPDLDVHVEWQPKMKKDCIFTISEYEKMQNVFREDQLKYRRGIFFVVNNGGHCNADINKVVSHFMDFDFNKFDTLFKDRKGEIVWGYRSKDEIEQLKEDFLQTLLNEPLEPSIINETKNGLHAYWLIDQMDIASCNDFSSIQEAIINHFGSYKGGHGFADHCITDLVRVMRLPGWTHLKDPDEPFTVKVIKFNPELKYTQSQIATHFGANLPNTDNIRLVQPNEPLNLRVEPTKIEGTAKRKFDNYNDFLAWIRSYDLRDFLGINTELGSHFKCIFHDDTTPSAVITELNGTYKYFCYGNCDFNQKLGSDAVDIVMRREGISFKKAVDYICSHFNIEFKTSWFKREKDKYEGNLTLLTATAELKDKYPYLQRITSYARPLLEFLNEFGLTHINSQNVSADSQSLFWVSNRYVAEQVRKNQPKVNQYLNLFAVLGLINKVDKSLVPTEIRGQLKNDVAKFGREIGFYTIPDYHQIASVANNRAKKMIKNGFSIKSMSRRFLVSMFGEQFADNIYGQERYTNNTEAIRDAIKEAVLKDIYELQGFSTFNHLVEKGVWFQGHRIGKDRLYVEFKKVVPELLQGYELIHQKANKTLAQRFGLASYCNIIYDERLL